MQWSGLPPRPVGGGWTMVPLVTAGGIARSEYVGAVVVIERSVVRIVVWMFHSDVWWGGVGWGSAA